MVSRNRENQNINNQRGNRQNRHQRNMNLRLKRRNILLLFRLLNRDRQNGAKARKCFGSILNLSGSD